MNEYTGFWIKEEFAYHYFHKSDILYRFIRDYQQDKNRNDLAMQYYYITNSFSKSSLISHIKRYRQHRTNIETVGDQLKIHKNMQAMSLHIHEKHLKFRCETLHDAEDLLFPALRLFHPFLFIIENNLENYGWISPITMNREYKKEQVLYSYL